MPETRARGTMAPAARKKSRRRSGTEGTLVSRGADRQTAPLPGILRIIRRIMACRLRRDSPAGLARDRGRVAAAVQPLEGMDGDEACEAPGADAAWGPHGTVPRPLHHRLREQHLAAEGERLDPGGEVDGRAHHAVLDAVAAPDVARDHRSHVDADAHGELGQAQASVL